MIRNLRGKKSFRDSFIHSLIENTTIEDHYIQDTTQWKIQHKSFKLEISPWEYHIGIKIIHK